jgi:hypothetical protein
LKIVKKGLDRLLEGVFDFTEVDLKSKYCDDSNGGGAQISEVLIFN